GKTRHNRLRSDIDRRIQTVERRLQGSQLGGSNEQRPDGVPGAGQLPDGEHAFDDETVLTAVLSVGQVPVVRYPGIGNVFDTDRAHHCRPNYGSADRNVLYGRRLAGGWGSG